MNITVKYTSYTNGTIRDNNGKLVAFYDAERGTIDIDGVKETLLGVYDEECAMDLINEYYKV